MDRIFNLSDIKIMKNLLFLLKIEKQKKKQRIKKVKGWNREQKGKLTEFDVQKDAEFEEDAGFDIQNDAELDIYSRRTLNLISKMTIESISSWILTREKHL